MSVHSIYPEPVGGFSLSVGAVKLIAGHHLQSVSLQFAASITTYVQRLSSESEQWQPSCSPSRLKSQTSQMRRLVSSRQK